MPVTNVLLETNKSQAVVQPKSRYEYLSYDMNTWNKLQGASPSRPLVAAALKVILAFPAFLADVVRNGAKLIGNAALSVANLGIDAYNMAQKALYGRVQPQPAPVKTPEAPVVVEATEEKAIAQDVAPVAISTSEVVTSSESSDDLFIGQVNVTLCDDNCTTSEIEGEEEIVEEAQVEQATSSRWATAGKVAAVAVVGTGLVVGGIYGYHKVFGFSLDTRENYLRPVRDFAFSKAAAAGQVVAALPGQVVNAVAATPTALLNGAIAVKDAAVATPAAIGNAASYGFGKVVDGAYALKDGAAKTPGAICDAAVYGYNFLKSFVVSPQQP